VGPRAGLDTVDKRKILSKIRRCFIATAFHLALEYNIRKVRESHIGLKLNGTHHLLPLAGDWKN
jgi:hypothetical protein